MVAHLHPAPSISLISRIFSAFDTMTLARGSSNHLIAAGEKKRKICYLFFAAAACARALKSWLLPDLSALA
jgi:hypothetical protein